MLYRTHADFASHSSVILVKQNALNGPNAAWHHTLGLIEVCPSRRAKFFSGTPFLVSLASSYIACQAIKLTFPRFFSAALADPPFDPNLPVHGGVSSFSVAGRHEQATCVNLLEPLPIGYRAVARKTSIRPGHRRVPTYAHTHGHVSTSL